MKKVVLVLAVTVSISIIAVAGYLKLSTPDIVQPVSFFPAETCFTAEIINLSEQINQFKQSKLVKEIETIKIEELMTELNIPEPQSDIVMNNLKQVNDVLNSPLLQTLIGNHLVLGIIPPTKPELTALDNEDPQAILSLIQSKVAMVMKPTKPVKLIELLRPVIPLFSETTSRVADTYQGYDLHEIAISDDLVLYNATIDDAIVLTLNINTLKNRINTYKNNDNALEHNPVYSSVKSQIPDKKNAFVFVNMKQITKTLTLVSEVMPETENDTDTKEEFSKFISEINGIQGFGMSLHKPEPELSTNKFIMVCDKTGLTGSIKKALETKPIEAFPLQMAPKGTQLFYWTNTIDIKSIVNESLPPDQDINQISQMTVAMTGMELDDILNAFGQELGLLLTDVNTGGMFPTPEMALFIKVNDEDALATLIKTLISTFGTNDTMQLSPFTETHKNSLLTYVTLPYGADLRPTYTFYKNYLLIGTSIDVVKNVIDTEKSVSNLTLSPEFSSVDFGLTDKNNVISYMNTTKTLDTVKELILWGNGFASMAAPEGAEQSRILTEKVVFPVINGLKMYEAYGARSFVDDNKLHGESYVKMTM